MTSRHHSTPVMSEEDPESFLLAGGTIDWNGRGLVGTFGGGCYPVKGGLSTMEGLERAGRARHAGGGFWTCPTCPHCGGTVTPEFFCCAEPYA